MLPVEIAESTTNVQAWYMHHHLGMTYEEIGQRLNYSMNGADRLVQNAFQRQSIANIYKLQIEYCRNECKDSIGECRACNLYKFMVKKMVRKEIRS